MLHILILLIKKDGMLLEIPRLENDSADMTKLVKTRLSQESTGKWFMIVDNVDDFEIFYHEAVRTM